MTLLRAISVVLSLFALGAAACNGDDKNSREDLELGLRTMVLQQADLPEGLQPVGGGFADNTQAASGLGSGPTKEQLDAWGRILGYQADFQSGEPNPASNISAASTAVTIYETEQGAGDSYNDRVARARAADWQASHSELADFQQEEIERDLGADDSYWLHLTGYQQTGPAQKRLVSDDQIVFRVGRATGYLNVVSIAAVGVEDRNFMLAEVETLARKQIEYIRNGLDSGLVD